MKASILTGAVAAVLLGAPAYAHNCDEQHKSQEHQSSISTPERSLDSGAASAQVGSDMSVSSSQGAQEPAWVPGASEPSVSGRSEMGVGGSGPAEGEGMTSSDVCPPGSESQATGGSGDSWTSDEQAQGGSGAFDTSAAQLEEQERQRRSDDNDMKGLTVAAGAGVEGYSFDLAPEIDPGAAWAATATLRPTRVLGLELGYTGAANEISNETGTDGPDIIRHGAQALATLGLTASAVQPYVLGGIGISRYNVRADESGFEDDTTGNVPVGVGLRTHIGDFTADLRGAYNFLFDQDFAAGVDTTTVGLGDEDANLGGGRYQATLSIGTTF